MQKKEHITHITANKIAKIKSKTDWQKVSAMSQAEVEKLANEDDGFLPEDWTNTVILGLPPRKKDIHIRLDSDLIDWFKAQGAGYQTRINSVLRSFVQSKQTS